MTAYSLCIPRIFNNIPDNKITTTFENLDIGKIKNIDIIHKIGRDGSTFKMAFVHFESWNYYNSSADNLRKQIEDPNVVAKIVYDDPWHWILLPNTSNVTSESAHTTPYSPPGITKQLNNKFHVINPSLEERLTNLENELHCVYEELYQREYIPSRYRRESYWDGDIETGTDTDSDIELLHSRAMTPMSISELDTHDYSDDTKLHEEPNLANYIPFGNTQCDSDSDSHSHRDTDSDIELLHSRAMTPMSISELDTHDYSDDAKLHEAPNLANCIPFGNTQCDSHSHSHSHRDTQYVLEDDELSVLSDISFQQQQYQDNIYNYQYDIEQGGKDGSYVVTVNQNDKLWVTANYCGND
jgi:hypothetical protein